MSDQRRQPDDSSGISDEDRSAIVDSLIEEMSELFHGYVRGEYAFDEVTFDMYDTLQTLHAVATGNFTIEWVSEDNVSGQNGSAGGSGAENGKRGRKGSKGRGQGH